MLAMFLIFAFLGVRVQDIPDALYDALGIEHGVVVKEVIEDSPAEKAGIKKGDIIYKIDDEEIEDVDDLRDYVGEKEEGDTVTIFIKRKGKDINVKAILEEEEYPEFPELPEFPFDLFKEFFDIFKHKHFRGFEKVEEEVAYLGVKVRELDDALKTCLGVDKGVLVEDVVVGSPADEAGIKIGDIIQKINDKEINSENDLEEAIKDKAGKKVKILIIRRGKKKEIKVKIGKRKQYKYRYEIKIEPEKEEKGYLGVWLKDLDDALKSALDIDYGVIIEKVEENSPAEKAGLKEGDIILEFNGEKINSVEEVTKLIKEHPDEEVDMLILRKGKKKKIKVKIGKRSYKKFKFKPPELDVEIFKGGKV